MRTPKKNGLEEDFFSPALPRHTGDSAGAWGKKPLSHVLRQQRESRKLSLQEVARLTRIPVKDLHLLEEVKDEWLLAEPLSLIPALRRYATFLNLNPDGAVAQFITELEKLSPLEGEAGSDARPTQLLTHRPQPSSRALPRTLLLLLTLGLAPFIGYYSVRTWLQRVKQDPLASIPLSPAAAPMPQSEVPPPASSPVPSAPPVDMGQPPLALPPVESPSITATPPAEPLSSASHHLRIQATTRTWLHVTIDEQPKKRLFLRPGQSREWTAERGFTLSLGDAGGVKLTLDGRELLPVGKAGQMALNVRLPSQRGS